jgi:hypothetical protein
MVSVTGAGRYVFLYAAPQGNGYQTGNRQLQGVTAQADRIGTPAVQQTVACQLSVCKSMVSVTGAGRYVFLSLPCDVLVPPSFNHDSQIVAGAMLGGQIGELNNQATKGTRVTTDDGVCKSMVSVTGAGRYVFLSLPCDVLVPPSFFFFFFAYQ